MVSCLFVHLVYLIGLPARLLVAISWTVSLVKHGSRGSLILADAPVPQTAARPDVDRSSGCSAPQCEVDVDVLRLSFLTVAYASGMLGLPEAVRACLFDLDGVLTQTAEIHAAAWKEIFDAYLRERATKTGERFVPFDAVADYDEYVDGKPRGDGVSDFLASRGIELPVGEHGDPPSAETVHGLGNRKNELVLSVIRESGVEAYEGSVRYLQAAQQARLRRAVVSSSSNCRDVVVAAGIEGLLEVRIDGIVAERQHLRGKPAPDTFLAGARALGVVPAAAAVFEDALAGVSAGRAGGFGCVVGVDRIGQAEALRMHGADLVVADLAELLEP
jgi:beta-phosphoglucomutase family hydrolase